MKWSSRKQERFHKDYYFTARKSGYKATVTYNDYSKSFYFVVSNGEKHHNSLWDKKAYKTEEDCKTACEKWIDEHGKENE